MQREVSAAPLPGPSAERSPDGARLVWADLTQEEAASSLFAHASQTFGAMRVTELNAIPAGAPLVLCVELARAQPPDLEPLELLTRRNPSLPVLLVAGEHSDALAIEALRVRVRDYLVQPVAWPALECRISALLERGAPGRGRARDRRACRTDAALAYVAERFRARVDLASAARCCHMSASHFSRVFKREQGVTFSRYLLEYRIRRACDLLGEARLSVKEIGFDVGFNDLAYFSRSFRRCVGVCPTRYQSDAAG